VTEDEENGGYTLQAFWAAPAETACKSTEHMAQAAHPVKENANFSHGVYHRADEEHFGFMIKSFAEVARSDGLTQPPCLISRKTVRNRQRIDLLARRSLMPG
jgi:hypothetical protein